MSCSRKCNTWPSQNMNDRSETSVLVRWPENQQWKHMQHTVVDFGAWDRCQNTRTATQVRRCRNNLQNPSSPMRCTEQWLAHGWCRKGTDIVRGGTSCKQAEGHQRESVAGPQRIRDTSNAKRNEHSILQIDCCSVFSSSIDWRDDRRGLDIQCKSTRNYEWTDM